MIADLDIIRIIILALFLGLMLPSATGGDRLASVAHAGQYQTASNTFLRSLRSVRRLPSSESRH